MKDWLQSFWYWRQMINNLVSAKKLNFHSQQGIVIVCNHLKRDRLEVKYCKIVLYLLKPWVDKRRTVFWVRWLAPSYNEWYVSYFWVPLLYHGNLNMLTFISILCKSCFCIKSTFFGSIWSAILQTTVNFNFKIVFITLLTYCGTKQCIFKRNLLQKYSDMLNMKALVGIWIFLWEKSLSY